MSYETIKTAHQEAEDASVESLRTYSRHLQTRMRNVGARAAFVAENAVRPEDRAYGRLNVTIAQAVATIMQAVEEFENDSEGTPSDRHSVGRAPAR